jgi:hypothetical protein
MGPLSSPRVMNIDWQYTYFNITYEHGSVTYKLKKTHVIATHMHTLLLLNFSK